MNKSINILDKEYLQWVKNLCGRYRQSQIKSAVKVNVEQLKFNWLLGRDIVELHVEERWGESVITQLSKDLREAIPNAAGLSKSNIYYCRKFYLLYKDALKTFHQLGGKNETELFHQVGGIFEVPWRHHCLIMDKVKDDIDKALFYVHQTVENGWSRSMLLNFISTDLYEQQGKALTNFTKTLPDAMSDLAQELTKAPYNFAFTGITGRYNERLLKDALLTSKSKPEYYCSDGIAWITPKDLSILKAKFSIDWQKKKSARAGMRRMIKRLLKKYKYPPEEAENALVTVIHQCEQWTDNDSDNYNSSLNETRKYDFHNETYSPMVADERVEYYIPKNYNKNTLL